MPSGNPACTQEQGAEARARAGARAQGLPFVEALEGRRRAAAARLAALLGAGLAAALRTGNASARQHCLQAYAAVGDTAGAEQARAAGRRRAGLR